jgi:hypothetical protein
MRSNKRLRLTARGFCIASRLGRRLSCFARAWQLRVGRRSVYGRRTAGGR